MESNKLSRSDKFRKNNRKRKTIRTAMMLVLLMISLTGIVYLVYNIYNNVNSGFNKSTTTTEVDPNLNSFSVLVMGIDENDTRLTEGQTRENSRTDSLIYMVANKEKQVLNMVSIPRDTLSMMKEKQAANNEYFFDKINHAHVYGGIDGTIESVSNLLDVPVNFYIMINFKAFEKTIDSLGGIEVDVPYDMVEQDGEGNQGTIRLNKGKQNLNGIEALAFARTRYYDSDFDRGQRQLQVISAVIDKAKSLNALTKITELLEIGGNNVTHNMTVGQISTIISMFTTNNMEIITHKIGGYDAMMNGVYYYYPSSKDLLYISSIMNDTLEKKLPSKNEMINIAYQNYIIPLERQYTKTNLNTIRNRYRQFNYIDFESPDIYNNLPEMLKKEDLVNSPTINKKEEAVTSS